MNQDIFCIDAYKQFAYILQTTYYRLHTTCYILYTIHFSENVTFPTQNPCPQFLSPPKKTRRNEKNTGKDGQFAPPDAPRCNRGGGWLGYIGDELSCPVIRRLLTKPWAVTKGPWLIAV